MSDRTRLRKRVYVGAVTLGLALGAAGVAGAQTGGSDAPAPTPAVEEAEVQDPSYVGTVEATEVEGQSEAEEAAMLESSATVLADEAAGAAADLGTVGKVELDNENGFVVYSVEVTADYGTTLDVKVDAGDGSILDQQADDGSDDGTDEADDDDVQHENEHEGENDPDEGHED